MTALSLGVSAMLVTSYAEDVLFGGVKLESLALPLTRIVVGSRALVLTPLAFFVPRLLGVKQRGLLDELVLRSMKSLVGL